MATPTESLVEQLEDENWKVRRGALRALGQLPEAAREAHAAAANKVQRQASATARFSSKAAQTPGLDAVDEQRP